MPVVALFTAKDTVQLELAGMVPAVSARLVALAASVAGRYPVQPAPVTVTAPPAATRLAGKLSVRPGLASVTAVVLGFVSTRDTVLLLLGATALGANDLATVTSV